MGDPFSFTIRFLLSEQSTVGDLPFHALRFSSPEEMVNHMALQIAYFGRDPAGVGKKAWMFMRMIPL